MKRWLKQGLKVLVLVVAAGAIGSGCAFYNGPFVTDIWQRPNGRLVVELCQIKQVGGWGNPMELANCTAKEVKPGRLPGRIADVVDPSSAAGEPQ